MKNGAEKHNKKIKPQNPVFSKAYPKERKNIKEKIQKTYQNYTDKIQKKYQTKNKRIFLRQIKNKRILKYF